MLPTLETTLGDVHVVVSLYGMAVMLAVGAGMFLAARCARRPDVVLVAAPLVAAAGIWGAAAFYRLLHGAAGLASMGGIAAGLATIGLAARLAGVRAIDLLDAFAPGAVLGFGVGRLGCFLAGCCFGRPTDLPWGIVLPELGPPARHPVQLYAACADLALAAWLAGAPGPSGRTACRAMVGYGVVRFVVETLRDPAATDRLGAWGLTVPQACAVVLALAGIVLGRRGVAGTRGALVP
ncbi:MAG: prolipoprotein diacylglyceryl transferase [Candidatus Binatia bacterium]